MAARSLKTARQRAVADGFRLVPVQSEVAARNRKVRSDRQLLAGADAQQGAVVANAHPQAARREFRRSAAYLFKKRQFAARGI